MNIMRMEKKDFLKVPYREHFYTEVSGFNSLVIVPMKSLHDSGYRNMDFVAVNDKNEPLFRLSGGSDVIHIDGLGGLGDWCPGGTIPRMVKPVAWRIDCLPCGLLRLFADHNALKVGDAVSDFEVYNIKPEGRT